MIRQIRFFALKDDLLPVLEEVERQARVKYVRTGVFPVIQTESFSCGAAIPGLGKASAASAIACESFLVCEHTLEINVRPINLVTGGLRYAVDQLINPDTATISAGGVWGDEILLSGRIATVSDSDPAQALMKRFRGAIKKRFVRVKAFHVGPNALKLLKSGTRLTDATQCPREFDLKMP